MTAQWNRQESDGRQFFEGPPTFRIEDENAQTLMELNVELGTFVGNNHRILYGVDLSTESIGSDRLMTDAFTGEMRPTRGTVSDGSRYRSFAAYVQDRMRLGRFATLTVGGRFNNVWLAGSDVSEWGSYDYTSSSSAFTGLASLMVHATSTLNLFANVTRGFRAPDIEDVSALVTRLTTVDVPNPDGGPEHALTFETGLKYAGRGFRGSAIYFYNKLDELLQPLPGTLNGLSFYDINQNGVRDITEVEVFQRQNIGRATIQGVEVSADAAPHRDVRFYGNFTYTHGTDELADEPFPGIPPATGTVGARWFRATRAAPWVEVETHFAAAQRRLHPADRFNPMIGPFGTDGFVILNARGGVTVADGFRFTLGLENALNEAYRYHASGIFRPGRQVTVGLEYRLTGSRATRLRSEKEDR